MRKYLVTTAACLAAATLAVLSGCNNNKDRGEYYYDDRGHAIAQPQKPYEIQEQNGVKFAVLQHGSLVTPNIDKWRAMTPTLFAKLSGITVKVPVEDTSHRSGVYMTVKYDGSEAVPDLKFANVTANTLVPKELNGWVAVTPEQLAALVDKFMKK